VPLTSYSPADTPGPDQKPLPSQLSPGVKPCRRAREGKGYEQRHQAEDGPLDGPDPTVAPSGSLARRHTPIRRPISKNTSIPKNKPAVHSEAAMMRCIYVRPQPQKLPRSRSPTLSERLSSRRRGRTSISCCVGDRSESSSACFSPEYHNGQLHPPNQHGADGPPHHPRLVRLDQAERPRQPTGRPTVESFTLSSYRFVPCAFAVQENITVERTASLTASATLSLALAVVLDL